MSKIDYIQKFLGIDLNKSDFYTIGNTHLCNKSDLVTFRRDLTLTQLDSKYKIEERCIPYQNTGYYERKDPEIYFVFCISDVGNDHDYEETTFVYNIDSNQFRSFKRNNFKL